MNSFWETMMKWSIAGLAGVLVVIATIVLCSFLFLIYFGLKTDALLTLCFIAAWVIAMFIGRKVLKSMGVWDDL